MANRSFQDKNYTVIKREITIYGAVSVGAAGAVTLKKWQYPTLGAGANARTYVTATSANTLPSGNPYPLQYFAGAEGIRSVTRTAAGLWTIKLQDNYQRVLYVHAQGSLAGGLSAIVAAARNTTVDSMTAQGGSEFGIALLSATATALDPASGETILLEIKLADGTEP